MKREIKGDTLAVMDDRENIVLTIKVSTTEGTTRLIVSGSITHDAAPEFEDELMSILTSRDKTMKHKVVVDFSALEHISAPALQTLLTVQRLVDEDRFIFHIQNITGAVKDTFIQTGFIDLLEIR